MAARLALPAVLGFLLASPLAYNPAGVLGQTKSAPLEKRTAKEIKQTLASILNPKDKNEDDNGQALAKLKAYRYLAGVPYKDLVLDKAMNKMCQAGAELCEKLGKLEHRPKNPGMSEAEFKLAYKGTSQSNLAFGYASPAAAVDGWMFDSDQSNVQKLGHRRWCINPTMQKTGFGQAGKYSAMFSFDQSRKVVPDYDFISFPVRGFMPMEYFSPKHAWSVSLNPRRFSIPAKGITPQVYHADAAGKPRDDALVLDTTEVSTEGFGVPNCMIFRPEKLELTAGERFVVVLPGVYSVAQKRSVTLKYVVEFVD